MRNLASARCYRAFAASLLLLAQLLARPCDEGRLAAAQPDTIREDNFDEVTKLLPQYVLRPNVDGAKPFRLVDEPILRWTNPVRKTRDGATFLWLDGARPAAVMCAFWSSRSGLEFKHEFQSLHSESFTATLANESVWLPEEAGLHFRPVAKSPGVAKNKNLRLVQMRQIASAYQGSLVPSKRPMEQLRLLSQPLYRYSSRQTTPDVVDGAIFAFVQTTDPEILVILEAREEPSGAATWNIAFARMSRWPLQVVQGSEVVWSCEWGANKMEDPYRVLTHNVEQSQ